MKRAVVAAGGAGTCIKRGVSCLSANPSPQYGWTPLHQAARQAWPWVVEKILPVVEKLLAAGANMEAKDTVRQGAGGWIENREGSQVDTQLFLLTGCL